MCSRLKASKDLNIPSLTLSPIDFPLGLAGDVTLSSVHVEVFPEHAAIPAAINPTFALDPSLGHYSSDGGANSLSGPSEEVGGGLGIPGICW